MTALQEFLKCNRLRQVDLVKYLDVSRPYMSQLVNGSARLSPDKFNKLVENKNGWDTSMLTLEEPVRTEPEIILLREKVKYLEQMLDEKERLINVLMEKQ